MNITLTKDKIICGNAYELIKQIPDKSIDLIITDPPYEYGNNGGGALVQKREIITKNTYLYTSKQVEQKKQKD